MFRELIAAATETIEETFDVPLVMYRSELEPVEVVIVSQRQLGEVEAELRDVYRAQSLMWEQANSGVGVLDRTPHTKEALVAYASRKNLTPQHVAAALTQAELQFDPDNWDDMLAAIDNYAPRAQA